MEVHYTAVADTDIGITRYTNQDSVLLKHASCALGEVVLAVVCDGMGGLSKGEVASAAAVREFSVWFERELPLELGSLNMRVIGSRWSKMLIDLNEKILGYSRDKNISMGTTFTGMLFAGDEYMIAHIGDSRAYRIDSSVRQLTTDHTFVAREIGRGTLTIEQAKTDKRRNMLLQCVGASEIIEPEIIVGRVERGVYMLCSDGFRHEITDSEIYGKLNYADLGNKREMHSNIRYLFEQIKLRNEKDNISVILIKAD